MQLAIMCTQLGDCMSSEPQQMKANRCKSPSSRTCVLLRSLLVLSGTTVKINSGRSWDLCTVTIFQKAVRLLGEKTFFVGKSFGCFHIIIHQLCSTFLRLKLEQFERSVFCACNFTMSTICYCFIKRSKFGSS